MPSWLYKPISKRLRPPTVMRDTLTSQVPAAGDSRRSKVHWAVQMNHRNRTWGFLMLWVMVAMHIAQKSPTWQEWALLSATYLLYPQLAWLVARRSPRPVQQELMHMRIDALLCGIWSIALHFPLWIGFTLFITVVVNLTLFHGLRGLAESVLSWVLGAVAAAAVLGWSFQPETQWAVTWTSLIALSAFLLVTALDNYQRSMRLHKTRQLLKASERHLQQQILEINGLQTLLKEQALRDPLTGLYNRHRLAEVLTRESARCLRSHRPLCLVLIDVDHFKAINDRLGHQIGDEVLRQVATRLLENTRASDWCFRYGGEEFLLVFPETSVDDAWHKTDALRQSFVAFPLVCGDTRVNLTVSAGLASFPEHGTDMDSLISAADKALYRAKNQGRNRALIYTKVFQSEDLPAS